jgi:tetratricopeptide (TPR) repeat protein
VGPSCPAADLRDPHDPVKRTPVPFELLSQLLPADEEFEGLRLALLGLAVPDPDKEWARSSAYATFDKRLVSYEQAGRAIAEAEAVLRGKLDRRFATTRSLFDAFWSGRNEDVARLLVELGEQEESGQRFGAAARAYAAALNAAMPLPEKGPQVLALRRIGRLALARGEVQEALAYYLRSADLASDAEDLRGEITALTGVGNAHSVQGWWQAAEASYRTALAKIESSDAPGDFERERGQLLNNLALTAIRTGRHEEASRALAGAFSIWSRLDAPNDLAICHNNRALLLDQEGDPEEACAERLRAIALDITSEKRAVIAIDLAQGFAAAGNLTEAGRWGRRPSSTPSPHARPIRSATCTGGSVPSRRRAETATASPSSRRRSKSHGPGSSPSSRRKHSWTTRRSARRWAARTRPAPTSSARARSTGIWARSTSSPGRNRRFAIARNRRRSPSIPAEPAEPGREKRRGSGRFPAYEFGRRETYLPPRVAPPGGATFVRSPAPPVATIAAGSDRIVRRRSPTPTVPVLHVRG